MGRRNGRTRPPRRNQRPGRRRPERRLQPRRNRPIPQKVELNFSGVDYINSTGIALIVGLLARARAAHRPIAAVGLSEHYREIFTITRLSDFMEIRP